jgi:hypothetical protein
MKRVLCLLPLLVVVGCNSEPEPTVGDAAISKGIQPRPEPKPTAEQLAAAAQARAHRPGESFGKR